MVDCGSSQCVQKRRILKKELLAWTKKVPLLLGLEEASSVVIGRRRSRYLLEPLKRLEPSEPIDWQPQLSCSFCEAKTKFAMSLIEERDEALKSGISLPASYYHLLDIFPTTPKQQCNHGNNGDVMATMAATMTTGMLGMATDYDPDQPLDLSATSKAPPPTSHSPAARINSSHEKTTLKVPHVELKLNKRKDTRDGKRQYTEHELNAAVTDIRSGKLGTRRAAALYGIPRSTLRNKIFRMENDSTPEHSSRPHPSPSSAAPRPSPHNPVTPPSALSLGMPDLLQSQMDGSATMAAAAAAAAATMGLWYPEQWLAAETWQQKLQMLRKKHDLNAGLDRPFGMPPLFYSSNPFLPFGPTCDMDKAAMAAAAMTAAAGSYNPYSYDEKLPFLHDLVRKFAEQRVEMEREVETESNTSSDNNIKKQPEDQASPNQLKIPSFKPTLNEEENSSSPSVSALSVNTDVEAMKDSLSSKCDSPVSQSVFGGASAFLSPFTAAALPFATAYPNGFDGYANSSPAAADIKPLSTPPAPKKPRLLEPKPSPPASATESDSKSSKSITIKTEDKESNKGKKTRPKRGQYRRYNHELLMEAVKAVQRGEMSVHRAGSYYGVPHSTLEYKVKERHLLRNKKNASSANSNASKASAAAESGNLSSSSTNDSFGAEEIKTIGSPSTAEDESQSKPSTPTLPPKNGLKLSPFMLIKDECPDNDSSDAPPAVSSPSPTNHAAAAPTADTTYLNALAASGSSPSSIPLSYGAWPAFLPSSTGGGGGGGGVMGGFGLGDPAMIAAAAYSGAFSSLNMSASDLLKKLHQKVESGAALAELEDGEIVMEPGELAVK